MPNKMMLCAMLLVCVAATAADTPDEAVVLKVGDEAPDVILVSAAEEGTPGEPVRLSDFKGKKNVLLAFYPKAFTPGCTKQMCSYRDDVARFQKGDTEVFAVSGDQQQDSDRFKKEYNLPQTVIGDAEGAIAKVFGVPVVERNGERYFQQSVFLIDKTGHIRYLNLSYDVGKDSEPLFKAIETLSNTGEATGTG